jgi:uncharacterized protein YdaU (DUF1376 family)
MHYYQFNIGDYQSHTAHLEPLEDLAYRRMLDWCYLHEKPLPFEANEIARIIRLRDHASIVRDVLNEFFNRYGEGWVCDRVLEEIEHYKAKIEQASKAGKASAERRSNARSTDVQPTNNQEPITNKHKPIKNTVAPPVGVTDSVWQDWLSLRKAKRAAVTQTAIDGIEREARKAGVSLQSALETCCARGWTGFKADWLQGKTEHKSFAEKDYDFKRARWEAMTGRTQGEEMKPFLELEDDTTN